jgi:hypothetical protein
MASSTAFMLCPARFPQIHLSFKATTPEWTLLGIEGIDQLPAVKWKLLNLKKMPKEKHERALQALIIALAE